MAHNSYPRRTRRRREPHISLIDALFLPELPSPPRYHAHSVRVVARDKDGRRHEYSACSASPRTNKSRSSSSSTTSKSSRYRTRQDESPPRNTSHILDDLKLKAAALFKSQSANQDQDSPRSSKRHDSPRSERRDRTPRSHDSLREFSKSKRHDRPCLKVSSPRDSALPKTISPSPCFTRESISTHLPAQAPPLRQLFVAGTNPAARNIQYLQQALDHKQALLKLHPSNEGLLTAVTALKAQLNSVLDSVASTQSHVWTSPPQAPNQARVPQPEVVSPLPSPQPVSSPSVEDKVVNDDPVALSDELDRLTIRHHLCSVCGNIRSPEFHTSHPLGQPVQNICTACRENGTQSEITKERHFCCGCGIVRSKQYQHQHPMPATEPNYCNGCKMSARVFADVMETSVLNQPSSSHVDQKDDGRVYKAPYVEDASASNLSPTVPAFNARQPHPEKPYSPPQTPFEQTHPQQPAPQRGPPLDIPPRTGESFSKGAFSNVFFASIPEDLGSSTYSSHYSKSQEHFNPGFSPYEPQDTFRRRRATRGAFSPHFQSTFADLYTSPPSPRRSSWCDESEDCGSEFRREPSFWNFKGKTRDDVVVAEIEEPPSPPHSPVRSPLLLEFSGSDKSDSGVGFLSDSTNDSDN